MKIRELTRKHEVNVLAVYWAEYSGKMEKLFLMIPYEGYEGVTAVSESECEITDSSLDGFKLVRGASQGDMLVLGAVLEDNLLDRMIDHDPAAMAEFHIKQERTGDHSAALPQRPEYDAPHPPSNPDP